MDSSAKSVVVVIRIYLGLSRLLGPAALIRKLLHLGTRSHYSCCLHPLLGCLGGDVI